ncbi:hypothetical protein PABG_01694 [Paracoccidioides brasiliensis Pb03]|nr:hypothetical protein PABG_01694 [Paracoccidioides brasiliensis Pb03]
MARGDNALAGREEKDIPCHFFQPTDTYRKIYFKGYYLSISNPKTGDNPVHHDATLLGQEVIKEYQPFDVPPGYCVYIRVASVYFEVQNDIVTSIP